MITKKYKLLFVYCLNSCGLLRLHNCYNVSKQVKVQLKSKQQWFLKLLHMYNCYNTKVLKMFFVIQ